MLARPLHLPFPPALSANSPVQIKPNSVKDSVITYGPFTNVGPNSAKEVSVHYENNSPFLTVTEMSRLIEVSHWGNVAVEEEIDMAHTGAKLKGELFHELM